MPCDRQHRRCGVLHAQASMIAVCQAGQAVHRQASPQPAVSMHKAPCCPTRDRLNSILMTRKMGQLQARRRRTRGCGRGRAARHRLGVQQLLGAQLALRRDLLRCGLRAAGGCGWAQLSTGGQIQG